MSVALLQMSPIKSKSKRLITRIYYPLANEVAKGYSNATVRPSVLP